ncbi:metal ABC transporter permease [uncultured Jatrophihabitans sp.]|uniref:metal ABC transporter permease n=1 Tax=uncultured Jatrophihabitans sp. TaxID=1610747 RepID=UPI0035CC93E0
MSAVHLPAGNVLAGQHVLAANPVTGLTNMLSTGFIQHALLAGTSIALLSGLVGYFVVLRGQVFASDALSHVAYAGALAALAAGVDLRFGLFAACIAVGLILGLLGGRGAADDIVIGTTFAWILGLGVFFLAVYTTHAATANGAANVNVLFGSIFGISATDAHTATWIALATIAVLLLIARPLLFASLDPAVAAARGVPVRLLGPLFLAAVGVTAAEASQAIGALLLFGLVAAPPAAAQLLTDRPWWGFVLSGLLSVAAMWIGITVAYAAPKFPVSFDIMTTATLIYLTAAVIAALRRRHRRGPGSNELNLVPDPSMTAY